MRWKPCPRCPAVSGAVGVAERYGAGTTCRGGFASAVEAIPCTVRSVSFAGPLAVSILRTVSFAKV